MPAPDLQFLTNLKPADAIEYLRSKGYRISWNWRDTWQEAHAKAFTVAKAMKLDILNDIRESVTTAIDEGQTLEQFRQRLEPTLKSKGWWGKVRAKDVPGYDPEKSPPDKIVQLGSPYRLKTIYRANLQTAYMAGKYKRYIDNADDRPYWRFIATQDSRARRSHAALHDKVFRYDDPFWDTHYPPLDWNCRCAVQALSAGEVKEQNLHIETRAEAEELAAETQPGEGWNFNVGKAAYQPNLEKYDYDIARQYVEGAITGPDFKRFFEGEINGHYPVAVLDEQYRARIGAKSQTVLISDETLKKNKNNHPEIEISDYQKLQKIIEKADVIVKKNDRFLVFIQDGDKYYLSSIKTTQDHKELFVTSLRITNVEDVTREKKTGEVIFERSK